MGPVAAGGVCEGGGVASDTSTMAVPSGMEQRGFAAGRVLMDERRMAALSRVVAASTTARPGKVDASVQL